MGLEHQENSEFYDRWANSYDKDENSTIYIDELNFYKFWQHRKLQKCLEIGCGSGRNTTKIANNNNWIHAIDISKNMVEIAKTKIKNDKIIFEVGDFAAIDLPQNYFDFSIISLVLEHIEDLQATFSKIYSHLKPQSSLYISEIHPFRMENGSGARFIDKDSQKEIRARSFAHKEIDFEIAAQSTGFQISQKSIFYGTAQMAKQNSNWSKYSCKPMILVYEFYKP